MRKSFERQLRSGLARTQVGTDVHPNADTLSAFRERRLSPSTRDDVATHLAACEACRELLALSAAERPAAKRPWKPILVRAAAAAVLIVVFAGSMSRLDVQNTIRIFSLTTSRPEYAVANRSPLLSYASAELRTPAIPLLWRVRKKGASPALEASLDEGKTWKAVQLGSSFQPKEVRFKGTDVWVEGRAGDTLVSRDSGQRWVHLGVPSKNGQ